MIYLYYYLKILCNSPQKAKSFMAVKTDIVEIKCVSPTYKYKECHAGGRVVFVTLKQIEIGHDCVRTGPRPTFGIRDESIWVHSGCSGKFFVTIVSKYV